MAVVESSLNYVIRVYDDPARIDPKAWDALATQSPRANPFVTHDYLAALHQSASANELTGWIPQFVTVWLGDAMQAASAVYLKSHSYGEYVFDWSWADAY